MIFDINDAPPPERVPTTAERMQSRLDGAILLTLSRMVRPMPTRWLARLSADRFGGVITSKAATRSLRRIVGRGHAVRTGWNHHPRWRITDAGRANSPPK